MDTPHLVETMLAGLLLSEEACQAYPELGYLQQRAEPGQAPIQWLLTTADVPLARGLIRHVALALLELLDAAEAGWECGADDACGLWHALAAAPGWLLRPPDLDDDQPDLALLAWRDEECAGDWNVLIEALHRAGSQRWQWAIQRCRAMQAFERSTGCPLASLLAPPSFQEE